MGLFKGVKRNPDKSWTKEALEWAYSVYDGTSNCRDLIAKEFGVSVEQVSYIMHRAKHRPWDKAKRFTFGPNRPKVEPFDGDIKDGGGYTQEARDWIAPYLDGTPGSHQHIADHSGLDIRTILNLARHLEHYNRNNGLPKTNQRNGFVCPRKERITEKEFLKRCKAALQRQKET